MTERDTVPRHSDLPQRAAETALAQTVFAVRDDASLKNASTATTSRRSATRVQTH